MHCITFLHGLNIQTPWALPHAECVGNFPQDVFFEETEKLIFPPGQPPIHFNKKSWFTYHFTKSQHTYLRWKGLYEFLISPDGKHIQCLPLSGASLHLLFSHLFGQALSFAMLRMGLEPIHATTLSIDGKAVAFIGDCGYGKSTMGAAFIKSGFQLLSDDVLVTRPTSEGRAAFPGFSRIKLFPEPIRRFLGNRSDTQPMNRFTDKQVVPLAPGQFDDSARPLAHIYVLKRPYLGTARVRLYALSPSQACIALLRNTFNCTVHDPARLIQQLQTASSIASRTSVSTLSYPRDIERIDAVVNAVLADIRR